MLSSRSHLTPTVHRSQKCKQMLTFTARAHLPETEDTAASGQLGFDPRSLSFLSLWCVLHSVSILERPLPSGHVTSLRSQRSLSPARMAWHCSALHSSKGLSIWVKSYLITGIIMLLFSAICPLAIRVIGQLRTSRSSRSRCLTQAFSMTLVAEPSNRLQQKTKSGRLL